MSKSSCEAVESAEGAILRMARAELENSGKIREKPVDTRGTV